MSLRLTLLGWLASGLRCPDHEISLCQNNSITPYRITLLQMPNGTGKTTTLNLLRATLSGSAKGWTPQEVRSLRQSGSANKRGQFIVKLAVDEHPLTLELNLDFEQGKTDYRTSYGAGIQEMFSPPLKLRKFLTPEFVKLFIFDGELAKNLLDARETRAREAIDALFQLSLLKQVEEAFESHWLTHSDTVDARTKTGLTRRRNKLQALKAKQEKLQQEREQLHQQKQQVEFDLQESEQAYQEAFRKDRNLGEQLDAIQTQLESAKNEINFTLERVTQQMRDPQKLHPDFSTGLKDLKANLDGLKLPSSTSKQFFEELAEAEECVCGRQLDNTTRQAIRDRAHRYLAEDEVAILNKMKSDIKEHCNQDSIIAYQELQNQIADLGKQVRKRDELQTESSALEQQRLDQGDAELEEKRKRRDTLKQELEKCEQRLLEIERPPYQKPDENTDCLQELAQLIEQAEEEVAEATNTLILKRKTDIVRQILTQSHQQARKELKKIIVETTNKNIEKLLSRSPVFLEDIQNSLQLREQQGASEGQTLSVSYAFLTTLFNRSGYQLPFIVDSPAPSLDLNVRSEVARFIPSLCNQFVAFTISSERQGFVDALSQATSEPIQYLTLFQKTSEMNKFREHSHAEQVLETDNGIMITGEAFFKSFDLDEKV